MGNEYYFESNANDKGRSTSSYKATADLWYYTGHVAPMPLFYRT
jgi:hypothetical protein